MKECGRCKETKDSDNFGKCKSRKDGLQLQCKQCKTEQNRLKGYSKKHYVKNSKQQKASAKEWFRKNSKRHYQNSVKPYMQKNKELVIVMRENYHNSIPPGVYGIRCLVNGKMYIGESKYPIKRRGHHLSIAKAESSLSSTNINLQEDLIKYGKNNFIFGIIEETFNHKEREKYWIDYYQPEYND